MTLSTGPAPAHQPRRVEDDDQFDTFLLTLKKNFSLATTPSWVPLFTTSATGLFDAFLRALPAHRRQHYTCHACRRFIERYGGLVTVSGDGIVSSLLWTTPTSYPPFFVAPVLAMKRLIDRAHVTGVFLSEDKVWGTPQDRIKKAPFVWTHMAVTPPKDYVFKGAIKNADQAAAEKKEEHAMLSRGVAEFPLVIVQRAHGLLASGALYRSEKHLGAASWLLSLQQELAKYPARFDNILWRWVAEAPAGFCHVRSGVLGTLLEDVQAGLPVAEIKQRFDEKLDPGFYQRPQAPPKAGNIATAERIVSKLKSEGAFLRRFARLEDLQLLWRPRPQPQAPKGVFAHLQPGAKPAHIVDQTPITMTWAKFRREVLPRAEEIEFLVPTGDESFVGLVTATKPKAPPILQWDSEDRRNPVSWYFYLKGSPATRWGLRPRAFHKVSGITLQPSMWFQEDAFPQHGKKVFFLLEGAKDLQYGGVGFFPEMLKSDYHEIRKTIEAHMASVGVTDANKSSACGIGLQSGVAWKHTFRVTAGGVKLTYILDRWD